MLLLGVRADAKVCRTCGKPLWRKELNEPSAVSWVLVMGRPVYMVVLLIFLVRNLGSRGLTEMHSEFCATSLTSRQFSARVTDRRKQAALRVSLQRRQVSLGKYVSSGRRVAPTGHAPTRLRSSAFKIAGSSQAARNRIQHLRSAIGGFGKDRRRVVRSTDVVHL